ncbi:MAG: ComEC/Rec2 family competence protein [Vicinamibacterales bacterium]
MRGPWRVTGVIAGLMLAALATGQAQRPLEIYSIDVEGGQATLVVTPDRESLLIDAGWPGERDAARIAAAAKEAGLTQIDYFVNTHLHADHFGSVPDLMPRVPIRTFVDNGQLAETSERSVAAFQLYAGARAKGSKHIVPKAGDRLPIKGLDVRVVIAGGSPLVRPLPGAGAANPLCSGIAPQPPDPSEDARSVGLLITHGRFRMIDLGDLTWNKENELACPANLIGTVDLYLSTRHGLNGAGSPALVHALRPRVAIVNNAGKKGASREHFMTMKTSPGLEDIWQLHYSLPRPGVAGLRETSDPGGPDLNTQDALIANPDDTTAHPLRISARVDGSFSVRNPRNGHSKDYGPRP